MKKNCILELLIIILAITACTEKIPINNTDLEVNEHRITIQQALDELSAFYCAHENQTRSSNLHQVTTISTVNYNDLAFQTRSNTTTTAGELLYIANFEDSGYAILAADDRLAPIIAIIEQGNLSHNEFVSSATDKKSISTPVISYIAEYAIRTLSNDLPPIDGFQPHPSPLPDLTLYENWKTESKVGPLVSTKWNQESPYNYYTPNKYAGCVAVALAQYITAEYYKWRVRNLKYRPKINNVEIDWNKIFASIEKNKKSFSSNENTEEAKAVAWLIYNCGKAVGTSYGTIGEKGSFANTSQIFNLLSTYGFAASQKTAYDTETITISIEKAKQPVMILGRSYSSTGESGHYWIIDGIYRQIRNVTEYNNNNTKKWTERRLFFHVNFGWGGTCDGYFYPGVFDLRHEPLYTEDGSGDKGGVRSDSLYYYKYNDITFSLGRRTDLL